MRDDQVWNAITVDIGCRWFRFSPETAAARSGTIEKTACGRPQKTMVCHEKNDCPIGRLK
jgi:hypothetical protein